MKNSTAVEKAMAQAYGKTGGRTRARNLSAAKRKAIAKQGAAARWGGTTHAQRRAQTAKARKARAKAR